MSETVANIDAPESQDDDATSPEVASESATPAFDEATWKKKLSGKDQALTEAKKQAAAARAEAEALAKWKAEREQADMTEFEKAQARIAALEAEASAARAEALAAKLARQFPLAADLLGDDLSKFDEVRVAEINGRLAKEQEGEPEREPRIDPNSPRRTPVARTQGKPTLDELKQALIAEGNPFFDA